MSIELVARAKKTKLHGDSTAKLLLIVLADYANDDGMAWPSVATMAQEVEKSERSIQLLLRKLEAKGLIRKGDQKLVGKYAKGRRPVVYKLFLKKNKTEKPEEPRQDAENRGETDFTPETSFTGETGFTPQVKQASPHGRNPLHPTGETHFALGVKQASPKPSKEPSIEPSRESTRAKKPKTNPKPKTKPKTTPATDPRQTLVDFQPDQSHIAFADAFGLDLDYELAKFRDALAANGRYPADPAPAFRNWLRRGKEIGLNGAKLGTGMTDASDPAASELERRARKLVDSSTPLKCRQPDDQARRAWIPAVARLLGQGKAPTDIVTLICYGEPDELAELGIHVDGLEAIA